MGVRDLETPTDIGLATTLYKAKRKFETSIYRGHLFELKAWRLWVGFIWTESISSLFTVNLANCQWKHFNLTDQIMDAVWRNQKICPTTWTTTKRSLKASTDTYIEGMAAIILRIDLRSPLPQLLFAYPMGY